MAAKTDLPTGQDDPQGANAWRGSVKMSNVWKSARGRFDCVDCWYSVGAAEGAEGPTAQEALVLVVLFHV